MPKPEPGAKRLRRTDGWTAREEEVRQALLTRLGGKPVCEHQLRQHVRGFWFENPRVETTWKRLQASLAFREEDHADTILTRPDLIPEQVNDPAAMEAWRKMIFFDIYGKSDNGELILAQRVGQTEPTELLKRFSIRQIRFHQLRDFE